MRDFRNRRISPKPNAIGPTVPTKSKWLSPVNTRIVQEDGTVGYQYGDKLLHDCIACQCASCKEWRVKKYGEERGFFSSMGISVVFGYIDPQEYYDEFTRGVEEDYDRERERRFEQKYDR